MDVSADSAQLRKLARAHAAGDISQEDYRSIRAEMIDACLGGGGARVASSAGAAAAAAMPAGAGAVDLLEGESPWTLLTVLGLGAFTLFLVTVLYILR
jgi:hypothetical protein